MAVQKFAIFCQLVKVVPYFVSNLTLFRHVSATDRTGKRYRNVNLNIFSIEDDEGNYGSPSLILIGSYLSNVYVARMQ